MFRTANTGCNDDNVSPLMPNSDDMMSVQYEPDPTDFKQVVEFVVEDRKRSSVLVFLEALCSIWYTQSPYRNTNMLDLYLSSTTNVTKVRKYFKILQC